MVMWVALATFAHTYTRPSTMLSTWMLARWHAYGHTTLQQVIANTRARSLHHSSPIDGRRCALHALQRGRVRAQSARAGDEALDNPPAVIRGPIGYEYTHTFEALVGTRSEAFHAQMVARGASGPIVLLVSVAKVTRPTVLACEIKQM